MGRLSTFEQMPVELRDEVNRLIREGFTITQIRDHLREKGQEVSNGAAGRYIKAARDQLREYREAQEVAGVWVAQLGERSGGDVNTLLTELLKVVALQTISDLKSSEKPAKPADLMFLTTAIKNLEASTRDALRRREEIERAALKRQADKAEVEAKARGMTDDAWAAIRAKFLGVDEAVA